jgi:hypothetical protein
MSKKGSIARGAILGPAWEWWRNRTHRKHAKKRRESKKEQEAAKAHNKQIEERKSELYNYDIGQLHQYGSEAFLKEPVLNKQQQKLLNKFAKRGGEPRADRKEFEKFRKAYGLENLPQTRDLAGLEDIRQNPLFQQEQARIQDLQNPNGNAYRAHSAPILREYEEQTLPRLLGQYGAGGQQGSGIKNVLRGTSEGLQERLAALRANLQQQGGQAAERLAQAPINNQFSYNPQVQQQSALEAARQSTENELRQNLGQNIYAANLAQGKAALGTNPYHSVYRAPTYASGINTGGFAAIPGGYQSPSQQFLNSFIPAAGQGLGQGLGQAGAAAVGGMF